MASFFFVEGNGAIWAQQMGQYRCACPGVNELERHLLQDVWPQAVEMIFVGGLKQIGHVAEDNRRHCDAFGVCNLAASGLDPCRLSTVGKVFKVAGVVIAEVSQAAGTAELENCQHHCWNWKVR